MLQFHYQKYTSALHNLFHLFYFRTYEKIFEEQPKRFISIEEGVYLEESLSKGEDVKSVFFEKK